MAASDSLTLALMTTRKQVADTLINLLYQMQTNHVDRNVVFDQPFVAHGCAWGSADNKMVIVGVDLREESIVYSHVYDDKRLGDKAWDAAMNRLALEDLLQVLRRLENKSFTTYYEYGDASHVMKAMSIPDFP